MQLGDHYPTGSLKISAASLGLEGVLSINDGKFYYKDNGGDLWIDPINMEKLHLPNGDPLDYFETYASMIEALQNGVALNSAQKAVLSMVAFGSTDQFLIARDQSKNGIENRAISCSWYDNFIAGIIATPIAIAAAAGCASLTAGCTVGGTLTFGGIAVPCVILIGGCAGGGFATVAGVYSYVRTNWLCDVITCVFQRPSNCWTNAAPANNRVRLYWSAVSGADGYQVVMWLNGGWHPLTTTSNTNQLISGMTPGVVYYFGARTICNNTATTDATWTTVLN